jgi:hypothetical protein
VGPGRYQINVRCRPTIGGQATARISDCVITGNNTAISAESGGQIISFGTNMLAGNVTDGAITGSIPLK